MSSCTHGLKQQRNRWSVSVGDERSIRNGETHGAHGVRPFVVGEREAHECQGYLVGAQVCHPLAERAGNGEVEGRLKMAHEQVLQGERKTSLRLDEQHGR